MDGYAMKMIARPLGDLGLGDPATSWSKPGAATNRVKMGDAGLGEDTVEQGVDARGDTHSASDTIGGEDRGAHGTKLDATRDEVRGVAGAAIGDQGSALDVRIGVDRGAAPLVIVPGARVVTLQVAWAASWIKGPRHATPSGANAPNDTYVALDSLGDARGMWSGDCRQDSDCDHLVRARGGDDGTGLGVGRPITGAVVSST
ncbi:unnamed protein product [Ilex paraguariensis]|uniref:Uncharacterized protein n=1 Tax=Ilex paraguariensis TaxID=185542 RepID=A0ABC8SS81_9AQUA